MMQPPTTSGATTIEYYRKGHPSYPDGCVIERQVDAAGNQTNKTTHTLKKWAELQQ